MPNKGGHLFFPFADGTVKLSGSDQVFRRSRITLLEAKSTSMFLKENPTGLNNQTRKRMKVKPQTISGLSLGLKFFVITLNHQ